MAWPNGVTCPACKGPVKAHCPSNPRCKWLRCGDPSCDVILDTTRQLASPPRNKRTA